MARRTQRKSAQSPRERGQIQPKRRQKQRSRLSRQKLGLLIFSSFLVPVFSASASVIPGLETPSWSLEAEGFVAFQDRNDAAIPGDTGTRFSLLNVLDTREIGFRIEPTWTFSQRYQLRGVFAPLKIDGSGNLKENVLFQGSTFTSSQPVDGVFQFNSYRLTYRYAFVMNEKWTAMGGFTAKVRDAKISLRQGAVFQEKENVGFVPLLHGAVAYRVSPEWQAELEFDALAAPQGRAEDLRIGMRKKWSGTGLSALVFYRVLEGGAENDEVYTFSLIHYAGAAVGYAF